MRLQIVEHDRSTELTDAFFIPTALQGSAGKDIDRELPLQGLLHLLVEEAVDDGGEHGGYDGAADTTWPPVSSVYP